MDAFTQLTSQVMPLDRSNVDTDAIIPKQYLKSIRKSGFGPNLFDDWRYLDPGVPDEDNSQRRINKDFVLNQAAYVEAKILLGRDNFGCGSSREHAVWAMTDYGFKAVISNSFADIFFSNCFKNGLLPVVLTTEEIEQLFAACTQDADFSLSIDLEQQTVTADNGFSASFEIDPFRKHCMLNGLDEIGITLQHEKEIHAYEERTKKQAPWLFMND
jgi:3-isopropylmalate/(R)-2-methylmalate dehydratase small subunit